MAGERGQSSKVLCVSDDICPEWMGLTRWLRESAVFRQEMYGEDRFCLAKLETDVERWVVEPITRYLRGVIGPEYQNRIAFARLSTKEGGILRIHSDYGIGQLLKTGGTPYAWVWYGGEAPSEEHGTAFFSHHLYGDTLSHDVDNAEHDRLLREESDDLSQWTRTSLVSMRPNRIVAYPADRFHGQWPAQGWGSSQRDGRIVIVGFGDGGGVTDVAKGRDMGHGGAVERGTSTTG